nr:unnamed protein product [Callosobruchus chinensis]
MILYIRGKNLSTSISLLQSQLNKLECWSDRYGFTFSPEKTQYIVFAKKPVQNTATLRLSNVALKHFSEIKFLGVIFDQKLTWKNHISYLIRSCQSGINMLRYLANRHWGADGKTLLNIYRSLIRSKLDYGCVAYASAKTAALKPLDTIHNTALRLILGAFRTTPIDSLCCESGEAPLWKRREILSLQYATKMLSNPTIPGNNRLPQPNAVAVRKPHYTNFHQRVQSYIDNIHISALPTILTNRNTIPPWTINLPIVITELTKFSKHESPSTLIMQKFSQILNQYSSYTRIFTDASKLNGSVGTAVVTPTEIIKNKLPDSATVLTGELYAILEALRYIRQDHNENWIIIADSLNALTCLTSLYMKNPLVNMIKGEINNLLTYKKLIFLWIPSHIGISGNERADYYAKEAANMEAAQNIDIPASDVNAFIKQKIIFKWNNNWRRKSSKLLEVKQELGPWHTVTNCRRNQVIITRLRLGHTKATHGHLLSQEPAPYCEICNVILTVKHILLECPMLEIYRINCNIKNSISDILGPLCNVKNLINFLRTSNFINKL